MAAPAEPLSASDRVPMLGTQAFESLLVAHAVDRPLITRLLQLVFDRHYGRGADDEVMRDDVERELTAFLEPKQE